MTDQKLTYPEVTAGLATKSDKIRALARAGYLRTEIAALLDVKYQHVRKVLTDAGITAGLQREIQFERTPVSVETNQQRPSDTSWELLLRGGFQFLGEWVPSDEGELLLDTRAPPDAGVYAFVVNDVVKYVGLTQSGLHLRLEGYRRGYEGQRTNARVKRLIAEALQGGSRVKVLVALPDAMAWNNLPINTAAGLEAGLIALIQPEWNILGTA